MRLGREVVISTEFHTLEAVGDWDYSPGTGLGDSYPWASEVLPQPLIVLCETAELELGHGLLVRTRVHGSGQDGEQEAAAGSLVRRAREVEEREKGER